MCITFESVVNEGTEHSVMNSCRQSLSPCSLLDETTEPSMFRWGNGAQREVKVLNGGWGANGRCDRMKERNRCSATDGPLAGPRLSP